MLATADARPKLDTLNVAIIVNASALFIILLLVNGDDLRGLWGARRELCMLCIARLIGHAAYRAVNMG
ncbi:MAG: hypothetical protein SYC29_01950 [Planctomycetota bacterium]|nr:hypothetical protein [Planctomycetota bacterium]